MSVQSSSMTLSKEMSVEESYSKTSISSSSTMMSSTMQAEESLTSIMDSKALGDTSALVSKLESDLSLKDVGSSVTGTKMSSLEKSSSIQESESSVSYKKSEVSSSVDVEETSTSLSMKKEQSMKMVSEEVSKSASYTSSVTAESTEEKEHPLYVVIMDYKPREGDYEAIRVKEGQEVEVLDSSKAHKWRVRLKKSGLEGTVPSCYLEKKAAETALVDPIAPPLDPKVQATIVRREKVLKELVESEEAFSRDMQFVVNNYIKEMESKQMPKELRDFKDSLFTNFKAISEFHNNVLMKGIQYYVNEPARLGKTFLRLERDFDMHVQYCKNEPEAQQLLLTGELKDYFEAFSRKIQDEKTLSEHLKLPIQRINDYQLLLKELIKYTTRLKEDTTDLEKAHDFMQAIPQRIVDLQYLNSIQGYKGNLHKLGRILKHDWFEVIEPSGMKRERFLFLFKGRIFITDHKRVGTNRSIFLVKHIIKLPEVEIVDNADDDELKMRFQTLKKGQSGYPLCIRAKTIDQKEEWLNAIQVTATPQGIEDVGDEDLEPLTDEQDLKSKKSDTIEVSESNHAKVEVLEDFEAYEEMHTVITESVRSGSLTSLEEGAEAILECEICSNPEATIAWLKDNSPMVATQRAIIESDGGKHRLIFKKTEASDSGLYTIIASNVNGTVSCSAPLAVHSAPEMLPPSTPGGTPMAYGPLFLEKLKDMELQEGTNFRSCVVVQGEPQPDVKFYKDDKEIKAGDRVHIVKESKECYELAIDNVTPQDAGKYSCVAVSSSGQNVTTCNYTVTKRKEIFKKTGDEDKVSTPEILELDQQGLKEGIIGKDIESSERFKVEIDETEDTVSLVFQHVTPDDAGMYTCVANTGSGKISCSAELTVQGGIPREPEAPKATSSAQKVTAKEGGSALLELTATGFPKPKITWTKDGKELKPDDKYAMMQEDDESHTMAIKDVKPDDSGKYSALAKNELGESKVDYELDVTSPPKFVKPMKDTCVILGEDINFEVEVQGTPKPTITWCKDGQSLSAGDRIKLIEDGPVRKLIIEKAKAEDTGNYSCTIKNSEGSQAGFGALQIKSPPKFVQGLKDTSISLGQDLSLKVKITGTPKPDLQWSKDGTKLQVNDSHIIQKEESAGSYSLSVKETTKKDAGQYTCEITNTHGKDETTAKVTIKEKPTFEKKLEDQILKEGEKDVDFVVKVSGSPAPKIKWYIGDMEITESKKYQIISGEDAGSSTLRIKEVTSEVEGEYKCEATNEAGKQTTSSKVTVKKEEKKIPPKFVKGLSDVQVKEEEDAVFNIKLSGTPKPKAKWTKDNADLTIDGKHIEYKVEEDGDNLTLIIHKAVKDDEGKYSCTITNTEGSETTSSKVTITSKEKSASFQQKLQDKSIKEGETVELTVKYDGVPKPTAKWSKDGTDVSVDGKHIELKSKDTTETLVIHNATKDDSGKYSCKIENSSGSETTSNKLTVTEKTEAAKFVKGLKDQIVKENEDVTFTIKFQGKPKPDAKWSKDGAELTIDGKHFEYRKEEAEDSLTLVLHKATKGDAGKYTCTLTNSAGSDTSSSEVKVTETTEKPKFTQTLKDLTVKIEEDVEFTVKFQGKPKPTAKWTKDGAELTIDGKHFEYKKTDAEDTLTVILHKATKADCGKYSCTLANSAGSDTSTGALTVTEKTEAAKFVKGLTDKTVKEEEDIEFTVKFKGKPKPSAKWTKDGAELTIDNKHFEYKREEAEDSLTLILHKATKEDSGEYACTISNSSGTDTTKSIVKVTEEAVAAKFVKGLTDQSVKEDQTVKLTVKIQGRPQPSIDWRKGEEEMIVIDKKHIEYVVDEADDSHTVIIHKVAKDDAGKYTCSITNSAGSDSTSCMLKVSASAYSPEFVEGLKDKSAKIREFVQFPVKFSGKPKPSISWTLDGDEIEIDGHHYAMETGDGEATLIINNVTTEDAGKYSCVLSNSGGTKTSSGKLTVSIPPAFLKPVKDVEGALDCTVRLNVKFEALPEPTVIWKKDGTVLSIDGTKFKVTIEPDDSLTLVINKASPDDVGTYSCEVKNPLGTATSSGNVVVTGKPVIKTPLKDHDVLKGEKNVEFVAEVNATPPPEVTWSYKDKEIVLGDMWKAESDEKKGIFKLIVKEVNVNTGGEYTLEAKNISGSAKTSATLFVLEKPAFLKEFKDVEALEGETIKVESAIKGFPEPMPAWYKGNKELISDTHCFLSHNKMKVCLVIEDCCLKDSGTYTCKIKNRVGEALQSSKVNVKALKDTQGPMFLTHLRDQIVVVGDSARLEAKIAGKPYPQATWYRNKDEVKASENIIMQFDESEQLYSLTLKNVKTVGSATYSCKAVNEYGEASEAAIVTVKEPTAPKIEGMEDVKVSLGSPARLKAKVSGFPIPDVKWLKDKSPISMKDEIYKITEDADANKHAVSINSVTEKEIGEFTCIASNFAGQDEAKCTLTIKAQAPVFMKELKDLGVSVGDSFKFQAEVHGYPTPTITWSKDFASVDNDSRFISTKKDNVVTLEVKDAIIKDAGSYMCKAVNDAGESFSRATLKIEDFAPKIIDQLPSNIKLVEGESLHLKAKVSGQPTPEVKWLKDSKPLKLTNKMKTELLPDGTAELVIDDISHDDAGTYRLQATNNKGHSSTESDVEVEFRPKDSKPFVRQLKPLDVVTGSPLKLQAKVSGHPKPTISWSKDGVPLSETKTGALAEISETPDGCAVLSIVKATEDDSGEYTITAKNDVGEDSSSSQVTVEAPGKKPVIVKELKPAKFLEGDAGQLDAVVSGHPPPTVSWTQNGRNVIEGDHCSVTLEPNGFACLSFPKISKEDGGLYTLTASNRHGKAITEAPLIVVPLAVKEEEKKPKKILEIVQGLMPSLVPEGRACKLEAQVTTDPKPVSVKWCKDGKELLPSEHIEMVHDAASGALKLIIPQMSPDDRGKYCVIVSDGNTELKSEALVNMIPAMPAVSGNKPFFVKGLEPITLTEGETLKLQAQLAPEFKCSIKWMKDGEDIAPGDSINIVSQDNGTVGLTISGATMRDSGKYIVIASNEDGKTRSSAMVAVVGEGFKKPEIISTLTPAQFLEGEPGKLEAKIGGEPMPDVKWLCDGNPLEPSDRIRMVKQPDGTVALEIAKVTPEDAGKYTLLVSNMGGETRCSAPVEVKRPPIFANPLSDVTAVEGLPNKLECKITGEPSPTIKWTKDGAEVPEDAEGHLRKLSLPDGTSAIVFDKCTPEDSGVYQCEASNPHGDKKSEAKFKVIGKEVEGASTSAPSFVTPLSDMSVADGDTFILAATVSGNPLPNVAWLLDGQPVLPSNKALLAFDGKKVALSVHNCNTSDGGDYECKLSNTVGEASSKCKVFVKANQPPRFIEKLSDMKFSVEKPMKLTCRVEGIPEPEIEWYLNGSKLENGIKYSLSKEGDKCILVLSHPRSKDTGVYECRAKNIAGKDSCSATVSVSGADAEGEPAMFLKKLRDTDGLPGMTIKLTACITGVPKPEIQWFKDGEQLNHDSRHTFEVDRNGVIRLLIRNAQKADVGTYRVSIFNMFGSDTCTANLCIEGKDKDITEKPIPQKTEKIDKTGPPSPLSHAPYIFKMDDLSLSLGWRPSIPHYPQVPSLYRLEMRRVPDGEWSTYKHGIKDCSCDVRNLKPATDYEFRVRVENKYGLSDPSPYFTAHRTQLRPPTPADFRPKDYDIEHPPLDKYAAAPRFLRQEEAEIYGVKGQPARIESWVYGCPQPKVTWYFNNVPVEAGKYDFLEDRNGQVILFISRMVDSDVGTYLCKAENEHGEAQQKIKLLIAEPPIFIQRLAPITAMIHQGGEFVCQVMGVPNPKIKWFKDWHPLSESSRIQMKFEEPNKHILSLNGAILKDSGLYTCVASNVAGSSTTSGSLNVEESEQDYHIKTYKKPTFTRASDRAFEDHFDVGEELGRGTQGITYHAVERSSGKSYAAKAMHGTGQLLDFMTHEMDIMGQLCHPRLLRLWGAYQTKSSLTLATDLCGGGELLPHILQQPVLTESLVAQYMKQVLEGLQHMHDMNIAHLGLTPGDILVTRVDSDSIKIGDFGLATRLYPGRNYIQLHGHPEYVAPEVANKQPVSLAADMWSVGIISYVLLTGTSPFLRENDRETLKEVQKGKVNFFYEGFAALSDEARDFVSKLLVVEPSQRMTVTEALKHKWLNLASVPDRCDELEGMDRLRDYYKRWKSWYSNASCKRYYRRRPLESCFTHPSRMIYPPDEIYTPPTTPERELGRSHIKPSAFDDVTFQQRIEREPIDVRSESHYQNGPDTFLLPLRDPDFPVRIRRYLKVGAYRSPILARHLQDKHWGYSDVAVKERRKFMDVMDEEIDDEKKGISRSAPLRLRHEVGTVGSGYDHLESKALRKIRGFRVPPGAAPFFREKIRDAVIRENENAVFTCKVASVLEPQFSWFRNDGILIESSRIIIKKWSDGTCTLTLSPAKAYDVGVYKCVARNAHGVSSCRARLNIGSAPGKPEPPIAEKCSDTEVYLTWLPPKFEGHCPTLGYSLEYKQEGDENWTKVASNISHEFFLVKALKPSSTYYFHVSAANRFGWSEFSLPSDPALTQAEATTKLELSRAQSYQQQVTESGQPLILEEEEEPTKLDYGVEEDPLIMEEGNPTEMYNFISEISRGRFSLVLKVWVKKLNAAYVAKACHITDSTKETVEHEFEIYKSLQHERIARLLSVSCSPNSLFFIMEKLSGIDVVTHLSSRPLYTEETVSKIIHQVLDALGYLHFRNICYFELQPDNVVMADRYSNDVKLVDFGSAQYVPEPGAKVKVQGCIEYLAPEVVKGEEVGSSADIWGVGVLTYILLSGFSPFAGDNDLETKDNVLFVRYHFDHLYKEVSQEATHFIMQLFKRTPQKRPTVEECLENKWLLPNEFMIKKREHAVFLPHQLREFSEHFHSVKSKSTPPALLNIFGKSLQKPDDTATG